MGTLHKVRRGDFTYRAIGLVAIAPGEHAMSSRPQPPRQIKAAGRKHQTSSSPQARKHIHTHQAASIYNAQGRK